MGDMADTHPTSPDHRPSPSPVAGDRPDDVDTRGTRPVALVTGGSRGIGRAVAADLLRDHRVIVGASSRGSALAAARELADAAGSAGEEVPEVFAADLTDPDAIRAEVDRLVDGGLDRLDVLVHSAGVAPMETVGDATWAQWQHVLTVNVVAVAELTRLLLPALRAAGGTVVAVNSGSGYTSGVAQGLYSGSKFALRALTDALREEERGRVRVSSVHPGKVDTDMQVDLQRRKGNRDYDGSVYVRPESVARAVRLAVETTDEAMIDEVHVRPVVR
ncbi:SDR family oxidoreductase [Corynebacterium bovis]|uniref:Short chain dehydrogenase n=3 Tax=Corynebacterium bovis TaxID=36808 RepID=A0A3R8PGE1_9CORY|nr:SDR family oxidoreductase [Corynebacterium bovis]RRO92586.1 short chain dehydrogenase [Corynebacterium bovis]RRO97433.1 short chain dehydrogenase [Corynebacterium bovis]RRQ02511.1 short chain dehydrogenase [Corynebacterium bovis]RRQ03781.1 short chain dehydrogenase [Corynebacterium bovis]RRQ05316.1 short chain dehydrogenase [Corynebacterium bovis]